MAPRFEAPTDISLICNTFLSTSSRFMTLKSVKCRLGVGRYGKYRYTSCTQLTAHTPLALCYQAYASGAGPPGPGKISSRWPSAFSSSVMSAALIAPSSWASQRPRPGDRRDHGRLVQEPGQRDLRRRMTQLRAERLERGQLAAASSSSADMRPLVRPAGCADPACADPACADPA
jgi:hypothetical protein